MKKVFIIFSIFILTACTQSQFTILEMPNGQEIKTKIAVTEKQKEIGLGFVEEMKGYQAMLFINEEPQRVSFWMKNMKFNLDIFYLDENKIVREVYFNQEPCPEKIECSKIVSASEKIKYILEIPAGMAEEYQLKINSQIKW